MKPMIIYNEGGNEDLWMAISAYNKYRKIFPNERRERRQTFYDKTKTQRIAIRERETVVNININKLKVPIKYSRGLIFP